MVEFTQAGLAQLNLPASRFSGNVTIFYGQGPIATLVALVGGKPLYEMYQIINETPKPQRQLFDNNKMLQISHFLFIREHL